MCKKATLHNNQSIRIYIFFSKCTEADINCYGLVIMKCGVLHIRKYIVADINSYGLVIMKCGRFYTSVNVLQQI
jgi:hypothetical protein